MGEGFKPTEDERQTFRNSARIQQLEKAIACKWQGVRLTLREIVEMEVKLQLLMAFEMRKVSK